MAFDFPNSPTVGQRFQPVGGPSWQWDGTTWSALAPALLTIISDTAPAGPVNGQLWWNSADANLYIYYDDGTSAQWVQTNSVGS